MIRQIGPGLVHLRLDTSLGRCVLVQTVTPVEPLVQRVVHRMYTAKSLIAPYAKLVLWGEAIMVGWIALTIPTIQLNVVLTFLAVVVVVLLQFERDVMVWNHKTYISRPLLVAEDRTLVKHRRWYQQFYSENSPRWSAQKTDNLEW